MECLPRVLNYTLFVKPLLEHKCVADRRCVPNFLIKQWADVNEVSPGRIFGFGLQAATYHAKKLAVQLLFRRGVNPAAQGGVIEMFSK